MKVIFWGTRGSYPLSDLDFLRYGGNTTCVEVRTDAGDCIIIDAGSGIRDLGKLLPQDEEVTSCSILLTHTHWDHLQGLTSFEPLYSKALPVHFYSPNTAGKNLNDIMHRIFDAQYFPLTWEQIGKAHPLTDFSAGDSWQIGTALVESHPTCHPGGGVAYKITADGWTVYISGDHEWGLSTEDECDGMIDFMKGADLVIGDTHFSDSDYRRHRNWGHSTFGQWVENARLASTRRLCFTHHNPEYNDEHLESIFDTFSRHSDNERMAMFLAKEGLCFTKDAEYQVFDRGGGRKPCPMCDFSRKVAQYSDPSIVLSSVLTEARKTGEADAGSIYLFDEKNSHLTFSYAQNETLFPNSLANKMAYLNATVPYDKSSVAGYVAITGESVNIVDVYDLPKGVPYRFNSSFDEVTGYRTMSTLTVPLIGADRKIVGVLQLINRKVKDKVLPFTTDMQAKLEQLALTAADTIERNRLNNALIVRMLETSALRDPLETAAHVMRVGAMVGEVYQQWAERRNEPVESMRTTKDAIRLAAMLHDVGKVGVPDAILKKPGKLTGEEFLVMQEHCIMGANLFKNAATQLDKMAHNVTLHHHQKWDGSGYTGSPEYPPLAGEDIPLEARITSVADVYDALVSRRCYKEPMPQSEALAILEKDAGTAFDPEIVEIFIDIKATISAIVERFVD